MECVERGEVGEDLVVLVGCFGEAESWVDDDVGYALCG